MAGILAAVLPGAGHLYTDRPGDALVAFLLNGAFIWAAVERFRHENYVTGKYTMQLIALMNTIRATKIT